MPILETCSIDELKNIYNKCLARNYKAEMYFEKHMNKYDKWENELISIINVMGYTLEELQKRGVNITPEEIEYGF